MCCDNRQRHAACASSPNSSWQQPWSSCRIDRDSRRHTDLFNVVPLNTLSCATHNADTNRKSLSVCLKSKTVKMFWALLTLTPTCTSASHWLTQQTVALVVSVRCVYNEPEENAVIPLDVMVSTQSCGTYTLKICQNTIINITPKCRCCMLR